MKIWMNRQDLAAMDEAEQQQLDEEAATIAEMQKAFEQIDPPPKTHYQSWRKRKASTKTDEGPGSLSK